MRPVPDYKNKVYVFPELFAREKSSLLIQAMAAFERTGDFENDTAYSCLKLFNVAYYKA
jgi:hypothetical protein